jgi:hypothetical protein
MAAELLVECDWCLHREDAGPLVESRAAAAGEAVEHGGWVETAGLLLCPDCRSHEADLLASHAEGPF